MVKSRDVTADDFKMCFVDVDQGFPEAKGPGNAFEPDTVGSK